MGTNQFVEKFPRLLFVDVETTGLDCKTNEVIEFGYVIYELSIVTNKYVEVESGDVFVKSTEPLPTKIIEITNITDELLEAEGISRQEFHTWLRGLMTRELTSLFGAYNAQFDALFTQEELRRATGNPEIVLANPMIDILTIYRDRYGFPHKLLNAIKLLQVDGANTHRAIDDIRATYNVFVQLMRNRFNPMTYVNRFGYLRKWGMKTEKFAHITYIPQGFNGTKEVDKYNRGLQNE